MAVYSFKTHWTLEHIHRRCIYRCKSGYYTKLDYVVSDGASEWDRILALNRQAFETVYTTYDVDYYRADKEEKRYNARRYRYFKFLRKMLDNMSSSDRLFFVTWTISDEYIDNEFSTLKKYFINNIGLWASNWLACEDYGSLNGRLHFHAVAVVPYNVWCSMTTEKINKKSFLRLPPCYSSPYGFVDLREIKAGDERKKFNYTIGCVSYGLKAKKGFEGYKPFHNRNFVYLLKNDSDLLKGDF